MPSPIVILDIETIPDPDLYQPGPVPAGEEPPFPPPWAHHIVAIGALYLAGDTYEPKRLACLAPGGDERARLAAFAEVIERKPLLVTWNGRGFDLPVLQLRAMRAGVPLPYLFSRDVRYRYTDAGHLDLCDHISDFGATRRLAMSDLARLIGPPGKQGMDGSKVNDAITAGQLAEVERYCLSDVAQTAFLYLRWKLLRGDFTPGQYHEAAARLLSWLEADGRLSGLVGAVDREVLLLPQPF